MSVEDETDSLLISLIEKEIPDGRKALHESHKNLADLSDYCRQNYINSADTTKFLEDTKAYASQSLASVAYQIHSLAVNMLQMMDQQVIQLDKMNSHANNIGLTVDIHKEKVARREIGVLTSSKNFSRSHKIVAPPQQEKPKSYKREEINFNSLDHIGHGVKSSQETQNQRRLSTASSTGSFKAASISSVTSGSQGSIPSSISQQIYQSVSTPPTERLTQPVRPPVAPVAPIVTKIPAVPSSPAPPPPTSAGGPPQHIPKAPPTSYSDSAMPPPPIFVPEPDYDDHLPPPPLVEDIYQAPPNNSLAEDLPAPPSNFYDQLPVHDIFIAPPPTISLNIPEVYEEKVVAIYDYEKLRDDELQLTEGDVIYVIKKNDDGWYEGIKDGIQGLFPGNYVYPVS